MPSGVSLRVIVLSELPLDAGGHWSYACSTGDASSSRRWRIWQATRREGERNLLLRQLHARFDELPAAVVARIEAAEAVEIERWANASSRPGLSPKFSTAHPDRWRS